MLKYLMIAVLALVAGCSTCADARADGIPGKPYSRAPAGYAVAEPAFNWTGLYVGGGLGFGFGDGSDVTFLGDARLGADFQLRDSPFVVGALAGFNAGNIDFDQMSVNSSWYVGGRVGVTVVPTVLLYGGYAYQWTELNMVDGRSHKFLAGVEKALSKNFSVGLEYGRTHIKNSGFEADANEVKLRLNIRTGSLFGY